MRRLARMDLGIQRIDPARRNPHQDLPRKRDRATHRPNAKRRAITLQHGSLHGGSIGHRGISAVNVS